MMILVMVTKRFWFGKNVCEIDAVSLGCDEDNIQTTEARRDFIVGRILLCLYIVQTPCECLIPLCRVQP